MKKLNISKVLIFLLTIVIIFSSFVACSSKDNNQGSTGGNGNTSTEETFVLPTYTSNGEEIKDYSIVISNTASTSDKYAADILQKRIKDATGFILPIIKDSVEEKSLEIILGKTNRTECSNINYSLLGSESYSVKTANKDLVISGNDRGLIYGVYAFLDALGYRFYTPDTEKIPDSSEVFIPKEINLSWEPTFEYRETMYASTWNADWALTQKINSDFQRSDLKTNSKYGGYEGYIGGGRWLVHTFQFLLPLSQYFATHPEYFAEVNGARVTNQYGSQPCFSSEAAYQIILANALNMIKNEPNGTMISISENDGSDYCTCSSCQASYNQYGVSGTFFRYINRLAGDIGKKYPDVLIDTLAYSDLSIEPPEDLEIADNVIIRVCPGMCRVHTDSSKCEKLAKDELIVSNWSKICKNLYVWWYPINYANVFAALPNYDEMYYDIQYFAKNGVKGLYAEGYQFANPEFGELKAYVTAKLMANPFMSKSEFEYHYRDFLEGYYGEAAEYIEKYHKRTKEMINKKDLDDGHIGVKFQADENFLFEYDKKTHTYDMTDIDYINDLWKNAVELTTGKTLDHVKKSRIHWTYIELYNTMDNRAPYGDEATREELYARNEELYNDMIKYNTTKKFNGAYELSTNITNFMISPKSARWLKP